MVRSPIFCDVILGGRANSTTSQTFKYECITFLQNVGNNEPCYTMSYSKTETFKKKKT
jgi:hypothetical protein